MTRGTVGAGPIRIAVPQGIGDCHWACQKLARIRDVVGDRAVALHIAPNSRRNTADFLRMVPFVSAVVADPNAPVGANLGTPDAPRATRWSSMAGSAGWRGFDYLCFPNGHLERGERIESFWPEIETTWSYELNFPAEAIAAMRRRDLLGRVLLYPSGTGPNRAFSANTWRPLDWAGVIAGLNAEGVSPVLVGAANPDDQDYAEQVARSAGGLRSCAATYQDEVSRTSVAEVLYAIRTARCWIGLNSGLGILAAAWGVPTVMLWSDSRHPIRGLAAHLPLHHAMQRSWLSTEQMAAGTYETLSFGAPGLTPSAVVAAALRVMAKQAPTVQAITEPGAATSIGGAVA